jgi:hypothetical protein
MQTRITPQEARSYLADPSNFWDNDELCYVCGELWGAANEVEYNGILFCQKRCFRAYREVEKLAEHTVTSQTGCAT